MHLVVFTNDFIGNYSFCHRKLKYSRFNSVRNFNMIFRKNKSDLEYAFGNIVRSPLLDTAVAL